MINEMIVDRDYNTSGYRIIRQITTVLARANPKDIQLTVKIFMFEMPFSVIFPQTKNVND